MGEVLDFDPRIEDADFLPTPEAPLAPDVENVVVSSEVNTKEDEDEKEPETQQDLAMREVIRERGGTEEDHTITEGEENQLRMNEDRTELINTETGESYTQLIEKSGDAEAIAMHHEMLQQWREGGNAAFINREQQDAHDPDTWHGSYMILNQDGSISWGLTSRTVERDNEHESEGREDDEALPVLFEWEEGGDSLDVEGGDTPEGLQAAEAQAVGELWDDLPVYQGEMVPLVPEDNVAHVPPENQIARDAPHVELSNAVAIPPEFRPDEPEETAPSNAERTEVQTSAAEQESDRLPEINMPDTTKADAEKDLISRAPIEIQPSIANAKEEKEVDAQVVLDLLRGDPLPGVNEPIELAEDETEETVDIAVETPESAHIPALEVQPTPEETTPEVREEKNTPDVGKVASVEAAEKPTANTSREHEANANAPAESPFIVFEKNGRIHLVEKTDRPIVIPEKNSANAATKTDQGDLKQDIPGSVSEIRMPTQNAGKENAEARTDLDTVDYASEQPERVPLPEALLRSLGIRESEILIPHASSTETLGVLGPRTRGLPEDVIKDDSTEPLYVRARDGVRLIAQ